MNANLHCPSCARICDATVTSAGYRLACIACGSVWKLSNATAPDPAREEAISAALAIVDHEALHGKARSAKLRKLEDRWLAACDVAGISAAEALSEARARRGA